MLPAQPNKSLIEGLACLQALAAAGAPIGCTELARSLGLETTRINRLLKTLNALGFARQNQQRKYIAGPAMHVLAAQSAKGSRLLACALPALRELQKEGLIIALGVLWQSHVCYLFHAGPEQELVDGVFSQDLFPALKSGIGIALLACKTDEDVSQLLELNPQPEQAPLLLDAKSRALLKATRDNGFSFLRRSENEVALGVAVGHPAIAGLTFAGNISVADAPRLAQKLHEAAAQIVRSL